MSSTMEAKDVQEIKNLLGTILEKLDLQEHRIKTLEDTVKQAVETPASIKSLETTGLTPADESGSAPHLKDIEVKLDSLKMDLERSLDSFKETVVSKLEELGAKVNDIEGKMQSSVGEVKKSVLAKLGTSTFMFEVYGPGKIQDEQKYSDIWEVGLPYHEIRGVVLLDEDGDLNYAIQARKRPGEGSSSGNPRIKYRVTGMSQEGSTDWMMGDWEEEDITDEVGEDWEIVTGRGPYTDTVLAQHGVLRHYKVTLKYEISVI